MDFRHYNPPLVGVHPSFGYPCSSSLARCQGGRGLGGFFSRVFPEFVRFSKEVAAPLAKKTLSHPTVRTVGRDLGSAGKKAGLSTVKSLLKGDRPKEAVKRGARVMRKELSSSLSKYEHHTQRDKIRGRRRRASSPSLSSTEAASSAKRVKTSSSSSSQLDKADKEEEAPAKRRVEISRERDEEDEEEEEEEELEDVDVEEELEDTEEELEDEEEEEEELEDVDEEEGEELEETTSSKEPPQRGRRPASSRPGFSDLRDEKNKNKMKKKKKLVSEVEASALEAGAGSEKKQKKQQPGSEESTKSTSKQKAFLSPSDYSSLPLFKYTR